MVTGLGELLLGDGSVTVALGEGTLAKFTENADGTTSVENLSDPGSAGLSFSYESAGVEVVVSVPESGAASVGTSGDEPFFENIGATPLASMVGGEPAPDVLPGGGLGAVFAGFQPPVANLELNEIKAGQNVPLKWRLVKPNGQPIDTLTESDVAISLAPYQNSACEAAANEIDEEGTDDTGFSNEGDGLYHLNWKTSKGQTGCFMLTLSIDKWSVEESALFSFE